LSDKSPRAIIQQLKKHRILQQIIKPIVAPEDLKFCFQCELENKSSSPSGCHVGHYEACTNNNDELSILIVAVPAAMVIVPMWT
jgi:uncharacterized paraquat-inducible protein A